MLPGLGLAGRFAIPLLGDQRLLPRHLLPEPRRHLISRFVAKWRGPENFHQAHLHGELQPQCPLHENLPAPWAEGTTG
jgi:hypothetical protein